MTTVSIIGTAGRGDYGKMMTSALYTKMIEKSKAILDEWKIGQISLVSGGAAWSDHVAVQLFLEGYVKKLTLHLPCEFKDGKYFETWDNWQNPGKSANTYHTRFSDKLKRNTLEEIQKAIDLGATVVVHKGFYARNSKVALSSYLIAFSWSEGNTPTDGGTLDTWNKSKSKNKRHVSLQSLV